MNKFSKYLEAAMEKSGKAKKFEGFKNDKERIDAVSKEGADIVYVQDPSEEVQLAAIKNSSAAINFIKNPTKKADALDEKIHHWGRIKNKKDIKAADMGLSSSHDMLENIKISGVGSTDEAKEKLLSMRKIEIVDFVIDMLNKNQIGKILRKK